MFKKKYLLFLLLGFFFLIPYRTNAQLVCEANANDWSLIRRAYDEDCKSFSVPYNAHIYHVVFRTDTPRLKKNFKYDLDFEWWISSELWTTTSAMFIQTYNEQHLYSINSSVISTNNMGQFTLRTFKSTSNFISDSDENTWAIVFNFNDLQKVNYIGYNSLSMLAVGDSGTENAIINGVTDIINNNNSNTKKITDVMEEVSANQQETNDLIKDSSTTEANQKMGDFYDDFRIAYQDHGLTNFVTSPLRLLNTFTTASCQPLRFPLPFVDDTVTLPCVKSIISNEFPVFYALWQMLLTGVICYRITINIFSKIHQLTNPFNDRIEVLQL